MTQTYTGPSLTGEPDSYDPQIHGFQYKTGEQPVVARSTSQQPTATQINISLPSKHQSKPVAPVTTMSIEDWMNTPVQWNAAGVYGGLKEPRKGIPVWGWILLAVLVLALAAAFWMMMH